MRPGYLIAFWMAVWGTMAFAAQSTSDHAKRPLNTILAPHGHGRPAPANAVPTENVVVDATNLGSPILLDKNWRVGVTANLDAAKPDFDDSTWSVRNAEEAIADVPDQDHPDNEPGNGDDKNGPKAEEGALSS